MFFFKKVVLIIGFSIGIVGFLVGVFSEYKSLGVMIFLIGFFIGSAAIITLIFTVPTEIAGRQTGPGIKIAVVGFSVTVLGQLIELLLKLDGLIGDIFFGIGSVIMIFGILITIVRIAR